MTTTSPVINIVRAGTQVLQDALVELLSHSVYYFDQLDCNELYPQLSQTLALRLGVHDWGEFAELRKWRLEGSVAGVGAIMTSPSIAPEQIIVKTFVSKRGNPY